MGVFTNKKPAHTLSLNNEQSQFVSKLKEGTLAEESTFSLDKAKSMIFQQLVISPVPTMYIAKHGKSFISRLSCG